MAGLLSNFRNTFIVGLLLAAVMIWAYSQSPQGTGEVFLVAVFRWMHVFFGILWIGLLYYFNFVQIRVMPVVPAELKPGVSKYIAPEALFWFRWAALATVVMGLAIAGGRHYLVQTLSLGMAGATDGASHKQFALLGLGMWLGIIMMLNVWGIIWPNQKRALGLVEADADTKAKSAKMAMLGSRTNLMLSLPMLVAMTMSQTLYG
jgi:uncharacterized membrane protein